MNRSNTILAVHAVTIEKELCGVINKIIDRLSDEYHAVKIDYIRIHKLPNSLDRYAQEAEVKIRLRQIRKINKDVLKILKTSTNRMILASVKLEDN